VSENLDEQLSFYLQDAHAIELQALEQVKRAPKIAGDPEIAQAFEDHIGETERHRLYVEDRLLARSWKPVPQKDITARVTGVGMALFARFQPDTPGKLVAHASSYERMELAAYDLLARLAERAGDEETARDARTIAKDELAMAERLAGCFDRAVEASLRELEPDDLGTQLNKYLADVHAIEQQAAKLLEKAPTLAGAPALAQAFEEHLEETHHHTELVEGRLAARGGGPSAIKDAALRLGALNLGLFLGAQADTPAKLAGFAYAFEHLEVASYELLKRVASRVQDVDTVAVADEILLQERSAAERIHGLFDHALEASLAAAGVSA
jgi:ferritin-like metal-binding protein YciE